jgi:hypothetical protein
MYKVKMVFRDKKSQLIVLSLFFVISALILIYYTETENFYISKNEGNYILRNIEYESCMVGRLSNGTYLDSRFSNFSESVKNYCSNYNSDYWCILNITKKSGAPTNLSLLNYTYYNYHINISFNNFKFNGNFTCN